MNLQASHTTPSDPRTRIMPPTPDLQVVKELMAVQRTLSSWKAYQTESRVTNYVFFAIPS
jgi:hypothetical protein